MQVGQSFANLKFVLENEPLLADCGRHWLINRIVNGTEEMRIIELLELHNQVIETTITCMMSRQQRLIV